MIPNRSYTFATSSASRNRQYVRLRYAVLLALILGGFGLRAQRLDWQPLWWDEGISVYFATESLPRMVQLTASDIHPPLYYGLLHGWIALLDSAAPPVARGYSVLVGVLALPVMAWLAHLCYPRRPRLVLLATLLLALNPMHLFYSQEVRMYALAMLLGMVSTAFFWMLVRADEADGVDGSPGAGWYWWGYVVSTALALYTIYYSALLFAAHGAWALWKCRGRVGRLGRIFAALATSALLYLPWVLYTGGRLVQYVDDKVVADNDTPLGLLAYLYRHALAFTAGHLTPDWWGAQFLLHTGLIALLVLLGAALVRALRRRRDQAPLENAPPDPTLALGTCVLLPVLVGFILNQRLPFFPDGGERLLLFTLPYVLLLLAAAVDAQWTWRVGQPALLALLLCAATGVAVFYTLPRYPDRDYRPLVRQVVQQGTDQDTFLALFPWQVGYWRAYAPHSLAQSGSGPHPLLLGQGSLTWSAAVAAQLDDAVAQGTLWFPAPLSLGSDLPLQIEEYLRMKSKADAADEIVVDLVWAWANPTTRLSAWARTPHVPEMAPVEASFGSTRLVAAGAAPASVASANAPLHVALAWEAAPRADASDPPDVSLVVRDAAGRTWVRRDYRQSAAREAERFQEDVGLLIPVGLPPGAYQVLLGLRSTAVEDAVHAALPVRTAESTALVAMLRDGTTADLVPIAHISVETPAAALAPWRLPIQHRLDEPARHAGVGLLGYSGYDGTPWLAGDAVDLTLFFQSQAAAPARDLYVSLLNEAGAGVAGWSGWTLPEYPIDAWQAGALVRVPVALTLPATLGSGSYTLVAGLVDAASGEKTPATTLDQVDVHQRSARFEPTSPAHPLEAPVQFGTHAELIGYDWQVHEAPSGTEFELRLHWRVLQTLLPPHHIFVHADAVAADGSVQTLVQDDGPPRSVTPDGTVAAPTGSWQPGEYLVTIHRITLPPDGTVDGETGLLTVAGTPYPWRVGLYLPQSGARLPASAAGAPRGDDAQLPPRD